MFMLFVMNKLVRGESCRMVFDHIQCVSLRTGSAARLGAVSKAIHIRCTYKRRIRTWSRPRVKERLAR
jgi:hypothetical protein